MKISANFYLTWQCNFRCAHCIHDAGPYGKHMTKEEIDFGMKFIEWLQTQNSMPAVIGLTGGEPTLHPQLWTDVLPHIERLKDQYKGLNIELHTNASRPIPLEKRFKYSKFFNTIYVGHDMFHREFRKLNELFIDDYTDLGVNVIIRNNKWLLKGDNTQLFGALVRTKGRGLNTIKSDKYYEVHTANTPRQECSWHQNECTIVNFTPGLINHCGEKSHPLEDGSDKSDFSSYTDSFHTILRNAVEYQFTKCGKNCSQKCLVSFVAKKNIP